MSRAILSRRVIDRLVHALIDVELRRLGRTHVDRDVHELDSLERFGVMAALCETFDLDDPAPLPHPVNGVEDWTGWVAAQTPRRIVVKTSGSTGRPRDCRHDVADLTSEAAFFAGRFAECRRVVALVPAHHLYGLIWTVLLPEELDVSVIAGEVGAMPPLEAGDMIVAVPEQWNALSRLCRAWPPGVIGISSAGVLDPEVARTAMARGLSRMIEVYGASETGGIGVREVPDEGFELLPRWRLGSNGETITSHKEIAMALPDRVRRIGATRIVPVRRRDDAVKVGGHIVHPARVAARLREVAGVVDVAVRLGANGRLKAFAVPHDMAQVDEIEVALRSAARDLVPAERPTAFDFGPALPTNAMGKAADWA